MGFFRKDAEETRERLPNTLPSDCLGETCVNFSGVECASYQDLLHADGSSGGKDLPPYADEASFAMYGKICVGGGEETIVEIRTSVLKSEEVNPMKLMALSGCYGDIPAVIDTATDSARIETIATSEG